VLYKFKLFVLNLHVLLLRIFAVTVLVLISILVGYNYAHGQTSQQQKEPIVAQPIVTDPSLKAELVFKGLRHPTTMAFLGPNDILVLEKDKGTVQRIVNGVKSPQPLLDVKVANKVERGMLGIAVAPKNKSKPTYVFLYYTESKTKDGNDDCPSTHFCKPGTEPLGNRLYRYEMSDNNSKLLNPKLLLDLPGRPGPAHNGGAIIIGPDNNVYVPIGDVRLGNKEKIQKESSLDGRAGILRVTQNGKPVLENGTTGILDDKFPLNLYYGYGLRNSFGIDFDPITKKLWDTENGPERADEINLVRPGFNSGWNEVVGIWLLGKGPALATIHPPDLEDFDGKGKYSPPEFVWNQTVGPTGIKFLHSNKLGLQYKNDIFVGDYNNGNIYRFNLNKNRTELHLTGSLQDKVANSPVELQKIIFGKGFGAISDLEVGPDGYLYVVSIGDGAIFRIVPAKIAAASTEEKTTKTTLTSSQEQQHNTSITDESNSNNNQNQQEQKPSTMNNNTPSESTTNISIVEDASTMMDRAFSPNPVTVKVGDTVTWTNDDNQPHTVTSGNGSDDANMGKAFDSGLSGPSALSTKGKTFQHQFTEAGSYPYFCQLHPMMIGKIVVSSK
jgi:glucose/arabinose dehydrogenase/plastocyanin